MFEFCFSSLGPNTLRFILVVVCIRVFYEIMIDIAGIVLLLMSCTVDQTVVLGTVVTFVHLLGQLILITWL